MNNRPIIAFHPLYTAVLPTIDYHWAKDVFAKKPIRNRWSGDCGSTCDCGRKAKLSMSMGR